MKIWMINPYGPIPGEGWRKYRFSILAEELSRNGHEVIWWTSGFSHHFKVHRTKEIKDINVDDIYTIRLVPTPGYKKNISFRRFLRDIVFSYRVFKNGSRDSKKPDMIIYYETAFSMGYAGQKLAEKFRIPVVFDQVDLWPELIIKAVPVPFRSAFGFLMKPVLANRARVYNKLDGFVALAENYLNIPLQYSDKLRSKPHTVIYNGIDIEEFRSSGRPINHLAQKAESDVWVVFAGSLGPSYDIINILHVAEMFRGSNVKFIIAGDGPLKNRLSDFKHISLQYVGKLAPSQLVTLYKLCDIGLAAYSSKSNVEMPDKFYDYTAAGLPIINSLKGEVAQWVEQADIGFNYIAGSAEDLYNKIKVLSEDKSLREAMSKRSYDLAGKFDQKTEARKINEILEKIVSA